MVIGSSLSKTPESFYVHEMCLSSDGFQVSTIHVRSTFPQFEWLSTYPVETNEGDGGVMVVVPSLYHRVQEERQAILASRDL